MPASVVLERLQFEVRVTLLFRAGRDVATIHGELLVLMECTPFLLVFESLCLMVLVTLNVSEVLITLFRCFARGGDDICEILVTVFECCPPCIISERLESSVLLVLFVNAPHVCDDSRGEFLALLMCLHPSLVSEKLPLKVLVTLLSRAGLDDPAIRLISQC